MFSAQVAYRLLQGRCGNPHGGFSLQFLQLQNLPMGQRVAGRHGGIQIHLPLHQRDAAVVARCRRLVGNAQVIGFHIRARFQGAGHREGHIGMAFPEQGQHLRRLAPQCRHQKMQMGRLHTLGTPQLFHALIQLLQRTGHLFIKLLSRLCQMNPVLSAKKQFCPQFLLQFCNGL